MTFFGPLVSIVSLLGYILSAQRWLKIPFRLCPLFVCSSLMISLFWAALAKTLFAVTVALLGGGVFLCGIVLFIKRRDNQCSQCQGDFAEDSFQLLAGLMAIAFLCALSGRPSVVDDYAYWAIIGKSIEMFDSLPNAATTIFARHLTYTPGLALFQYFFFKGFSGYSLTASYFGQNIFLIALLFALTERQSQRTAISVMSVGLIILVLFSGSVLQNLRADHLLSLTACAVFWMQYRGKFSLPRFLVIITAISCLFLLKEVGFLLALFLVFAVAVDLAYLPDLNTNEKRAVVLGCLIVALFLILQKVAWDTHCAALGFNQFHGAISLESIRKAFDLSDSSVARNGFVIFARDLLVGPADRLNLPYLAWYLLLGFLWRTTLQGFTQEKRQRYYRLFCLFFPVFLIYLAMNYVLQVVIFGLGSATETTTSLSRYVNIFFCWFLLFTLLVTLIDRLPLEKLGTGKYHTALVIIAGILIVVSSLTRTPKEHVQQIEQFVPELAQHLEQGSHVCITPGNYDDHFIGFRLLYYLLPTHFNVDPFPNQPSEGALEENLKKCDYLLVYLPNEVTQQVFLPFSTESYLPNRSLYRVAISDTVAKSISLQRLY